MNKTEEQFIAIEANREYNIDLLHEIKQSFDELLDVKDYSIVGQIPLLYDKDKLIITGELAKVNNIILIYLNELKAGNQFVFLSDVSSYLEMLDKYTVLTNMLRRIELFEGGVISEEAYRWIIDKHISSEAISVVLESGYFEKREIIYKRISDYISSKFDF